MAVVWHDPEHQCAGCIYNKRTYGAECNECRRRGNIEFMLPEESYHNISKIDKYTLEDTPVVSYGTHRLLVKK